MEIKPAAKTSLAHRILALVLELRNVAPGLEEGADKTSLHLAKIQAFLEREEPIRFVLPAFPAKSANPEKTLGAMPDFGEVLALRRLDALCERIGRLWSPGARLTICSDGRVFSDLVQVSDEAVTAYGREIRRIIEEEDLTRLETFGLDDAMPEHAGFDQLRRMLVLEHGDTLAQVRERCRRDAAGRSLFNGIHRFLFEDLLALRPDLSRTQLRLLSKELAYETIQRSNAWSRLVERRFPEAVRLSIHPQPLGSEKIGVKLLPSASIWRTPWHSAALFDGREFVLVRRSEAEAMKATVALAEGKYPCFSTAGALQGGFHAGAR